MTTAVNTKLIGRSLIGFRDGTGQREPFWAINPTNRERLQPDFFPATTDELETAVGLAHEAFSSYSHLSGKQKGVFLRKIAGRIESISSEVIERAELETALPKGRLQAETARTCGQLRLFAQIVEEGSWATARIDRAAPDRRPNPRPDIRSMLHPLGPVAVFGASNFPLAFSVAGGDTASALAAGNPVIVKAHPAHPGTSELVARAIRESVRDCKLPEGVFSLLFDGGTHVGATLVQHPRVKAVGFTGSRAAGRALMELVSSRPEPIPFFGEMSSTNPVFILPGALRDRGETVATGLHSSFTLGAGQFCTKPGVVFVPNGTDADAFAARLQQLVLQQPGEFNLLTAGIATAYGSAIAHRKSDAAVKFAAEAPPATARGCSVPAALFETDARTFLHNTNLAHEIFGPTTLLVRHTGRDEILEIARNLEGQLTATIHGTEEDLLEFAELVAILENKVGRLVFNGFPTGVEVCHAIVHGGPYPATSDGRSTSVGSQAILRFARPVCYQGFPDEALPAELKDSNPLGIWRIVDGEMTREPISRCRN
jgi:alpha-ketoglutaric semialdehyde dehydrogenase